MEHVCLGRDKIPITEEKLSDLTYYSQIIQTFIYGSVLLDTIY